MASYTVRSRDKLDGGKERVTVDITYAGTETYSSGVFVDPFQIGLINVVDSVIVASAGGGYAALGIPSLNTPGIPGLGSPLEYGGEASPVVNTGNWPKIRFFQSITPAAAAPLGEVTATPAVTVRVVASGF